MKFSVSKDKLLEGLSTVQNVVSTRTTLPILSNVLLQASDGEIRLTTTDLDVGVRGSVEAQVERTGATTLPARRLFSIVRELPASEIYVDVDTKNVASIRSGSSYFKILGLPEEEFSSLARFEGEDFHDRAKSSEGWFKEDFLCNLYGRNAIRTKRHPVFI
jgi:DNA polymerase-3 subunit beta